MKKGNQLISKMYTKRNFLPKCELYSMTIILAIFSKTIVSFCQLTNLYISQMFSLFTEVSFKDTFSLI
jgi:hypothetical protein